MAHREFECPVPRISGLPQTMVKATVKLEATALKWRALAERRRDHYFDLYKSGRWRHYYTDEKFLAELRAAIALAQRWAKIAPLPEERAAANAEAPDRPRAAELMKAIESRAA
ncbi:TIGR03809 family protein [Rhodoplanes sp. Z2-YC6860]|uniref:TIGR03809 family protein n=1 Tax=Rhodoplanes sp. Z2-YC6860 TaxID=674703 RepID=UPI00078D7200|nr:TIGR03809 family protein [Rhodoplanes sp. Z2-YC6860]AMN41309.1 hypothetical protein RHPLAN_28720 [Rhodoplanes sp. Z2-YC6860]